MPRFVNIDVESIDTPCTFRQKKGLLPQRAFAQVLEMVTRCGVLKVGQVSFAIDGTKVLANASKHSAVSYGYAEQKLQELDLNIQELLAKAEQADATPLQDGLTIPEEIQRRQERQAALPEANDQVNLTEEESRIMKTKNGFSSI
jgi:hypothetical protein